MGETRHTHTHADRKAKQKSLPLMYGRPFRSSLIFRIGLLAHFILDIGSSRSKICSLYTSENVTHTENLIRPWWVTSTVATSRTRFSTSSANFRLVRLSVPAEMQAESGDQTSIHKYPPAAIDGKHSLMC